ncbi:hypothetical protein V8E54_003959 [Elaphomyces granulatus]
MNYLPPKVYDGWVNGIKISWTGEAVKRLRLEFPGRVPRIKKLSESSTYDSSLRLGDGQGLIKAPPHGFVLAPDGTRIPHPDHLTIETGYYHNLKKTHVYYLNGENRSYRGESVFSRQYGNQWGKFGHEYQYSAHHGVGELYRRMVHADMALDPI